MTQLDLLEPRCKVPPRDSQTYSILMYLQNGGRLTVAKALNELGVYALSQRCGDLKHKFGWPIKSETVRTARGARIAEYFL